MPELSDLLSDSTRGASLIYRDALAHFSTLPDERLISETLAGAQLLQARFPIMGLFHHLWNEVSRVHEIGRMRLLLKTLIDDLTSDEKALRKLGKTVLPKKSVILTISYSNMVRDLLLGRVQTQKETVVYCYRSAPSNEGEILAQSLNNNGIPAQVISDQASIPADTTHILIGTDLLTDTFFINKKGTSDLISLAQTNQIPIRIVTTTQRYIPGFPLDPLLDPIFEIVPYSPSIEIITEKGIITPDNLHSILS